MSLSRWFLVLRIFIGAPERIRDRVLLVDREEIIKVDSELMQAFLLTSVSLLHSSVEGGVFRAILFLNVLTIIGVAATMHVLGVLFVKMLSLVEGVLLVSLTGNSLEVDATICRGLNWIGFFL